MYVVVYLCRNSCINKNKYLSQMFLVFVKYVLLQFLCFCIILHCTLESQDVAWLVGGWSWYGSLVNVVCLGSLVVLCWGQGVDCPLPVVVGVVVLVIRGWQYCCLKLLIASWALCLLIMSAPFQRGVGFGGHWSSRFWEFYTNTNTIFYSFYFS